MTAISLVCATLSVAAPMPANAQNLPNLGSSERTELSPQMERKLGEQIMRDIRRNRDYLNDAPVLEYLNNFGANLLAAHPEARGEAGYDYFFFGVRDSSLNAFALPGGFIGVHSGLVLAAQSESELASVLAHEIGHVSQRHIARMIGQQRQDSLIPMATMILAALVAGSSPDASMALAMGGQGYAMQRHLNFSRDAEREADRIGLQMLREAEFDTTGMMTFFGRLQTATRAYTDAVPAYLRSHPLTTERIADIEARTRDQRYRQRADSLDFYLVKARLRILQDTSAQGLHTAAQQFETQLRQKTSTQIAAAKYGLALVALRQGSPAKAQELLQEVREAVQGEEVRLQNPILESLAIDIQLALSRPAEAVRLAEAARAKFPLSRGVAVQYADALMALGRNDEAVKYLRDQTQLYRQEPVLFNRLAKAYAATGKQALQHMTLAEEYMLSGSAPAAIEQLGIARRAPDASFYDQAMIDAREREFKARWKDETSAPIE